MKLVFLGKPGAGKGTQADRMSEEWDLLHASTGDMFREAVDEGTEVGKQAKEYMDKGLLVPDEVTCRVVEEMVVDRHEDYVLDGFPRTVPQADALEEMLHERGRELDAVLCFDIDEEEATKRLTGRLVCDDCGKNYHESFMPPEEDGVCDACGGELKTRSDSTKEAVEKRMEEYREKTQPLIDYYEDMGLLRRVDASLAPDKVSEKTRKVLSELEGGG
ncbi:MAG: adenylate kinase [Planctomycetota bacterium]